jgi:hypothetical protein
MEYRKDQLDNFEISSNVLIWKKRATNFNGLGVALFFISKALHIDALLYPSLVLLLAAVFSWICYLYTIDKQAIRNQGFMSCFGRTSLSLITCLLFGAFIFKSLGWCDCGLFDFDKYSVFSKQT